MLSRALLEGSDVYFFIGMNNGLVNSRITNLLYAYEIILFCQAKVDQFRRLRWVLDAFRKVSRLRVNLNKSEYGVLGMSDTIINFSLSQTMVYILINLPIQYLHLPLGVNKILKSLSEGLVDNVRRKLSCWKANTLSYGLRGLLVNSVLLSLFSYLATSF